MKLLKVLSMFTLLYFAATAFAQKHPEIFDVSEVVVGAQRLPTSYLYAAGAWSYGRAINRIRADFIEKTITISSADSSAVGRWTSGTRQINLHTRESRNFEDRAFQISAKVRLKLRV